MEALLRQSRLWQTVGMEVAVIAVISNPRTGSKFFMTWKVKRFSLRQEKMNERNTMGTT